LAQVAVGDLRRSVTDDFVVSGGDRDRDASVKDEDGRYQNGAGECDLDESGFHGMVGLLRTLLLIPCQISLNGFKVLNISNLRNPKPK
jgi:hypothetical protein